MISARSTKLRIVDAQGAALAADVVLRLVKAVSGQSGRSSPGPGRRRRRSLPGRRLRRLAGSCSRGDGHDPIHLAAHAGIVDRKDGLRARGDRVRSIRRSSMFKVSGRISTNTGLAPSRTNGADRRDERVRRARSLRRPVQGRKASPPSPKRPCRRGQQNLLDAEPLFEQPRTLLREAPVAGDIPQSDRLRNVIEFFAGDKRSIERDSRQA